MKIERETAGPVRVINPRHFSFAKDQQAWVWRLVERGTGKPVGIRVTAMHNSYDICPEGYITTDEGRSFHHVSGVFSPNPRIVIENAETSPERLAVLRLALQHWHRQLSLIHPQAA